MAAADISSLVARRAAAGLAAISAGLHGVMIGHAGSAAATVLIAGMVGACLYCAWELWVSGTTRAWCLVALMNLGMVAVHLPLSGGHHLPREAAEAVAPQSSIMLSATVLSMAEVVIAVAVLCVRTRGNARAVGRTD